MTRVSVAAEGATLSARVDGEEGKPWILLSNSVAADLHMWDDQIAWLTRRFRVLRYDTRGHGQSTASPAPWTMDLLARDMKAVLDHFGVTETAVIGLSLGGMTALGLALDHPGLVSRLVVCDARADCPPPVAKGWAERIAAVEAQGVAASQKDATLTRWFTPKAAPSVLARAGAMFDAMGTPGYVGAASAIQTLAALPRLGELTMPVLYLVGEEDVSASPEVMAAMAAATPVAEFKRLPGLAHVPNMEDPAAFEAAVDPFLA